MDKSKKIKLYIITSFLLILLDQVTKEWARRTLKGKEPISYLGDFFRWDYAENTGAFLGMGADVSDTVSLFVFTLIPVAFLLFMAYYNLKNIEQYSTFITICFAGILAGGIGNIIDRIVFDRHVTDFMNMGIGGLRTGIFNAADVYITTGMIALLFFYREKPAVQTSDEA